MCNNLSLKWPNANPFGMNQQTLTEVEKCLGAGRCSTTPRHVCNNFVEVSQKIIGRGASAELYQYYNPVNGNFIAGKVYKDSEYLNLRVIYRDQPKDGHLVKILHCCDKKKMVFEELYTEGDLANSIHLLKSPLNKIDAIFQIAQGIEYIHSTYFTVNNERIHVSHRDIKLWNIFASLNNEGKIRVDIGDLSSVIKYNCNTTTQNYMSPSLVWFNRKPKSEMEWIDYNKSHGQKNDLFSFGLVCLEILRGSFEIKIHQAILNEGSALTQEKFDKVVDESLNVTEPRLKKVHDIVRKHLLRVNTWEVSTINNVVKMLYPLVEKETSLDSLFSELTLRTFNWSNFPIPEYQKQSFEKQINRYLYLRSDDSKPYLSKGRIGIYEVLYNGNMAFIKTGDVFQDGQKKTTNKCYSPITGQFYVLKEYTRHEYRLVDWTYETLDPKDNVVKSFYRDGKQCIVEEFYPKTLSQLLKEQGFNSTEAKLNAMRQIARGVKNLHSHIYTNNWYDKKLEGTFSHRRLDASKIFVSDRYHISCDLIAFLDISSKTLGAPEESWIKCLSKERKIELLLEYGCKMDIWKLGKIFSLILINKDKLFDELYERYKHKEHFPKKSGYEYQALNAAWDLVCKMTDPEATKRCDIDEVVATLDKIQECK